MTPAALFACVSLILNIVLIGCVLWALDQRDTLLRRLPARALGRRGPAIWLDAGDSDRQRNPGRSASQPDQSGGCSVVADRPGVH